MNLRHLVMIVGVIFTCGLSFAQPAAPTEVATNAFADRNELTWWPVSSPVLNGYHVYGADSSGGPFTRLTTSPIATQHFIDPGPHANMRYYQVTALDPNGESLLSSTASARYNGYTDEQLLDFVQSITFNYFWDLAHPISGLPTTSWSDEVCAVGGGGMALQALVVGAERGFQTRGNVASRVLQMLTFLEDTAWRYHGAWPHWIRGSTGVPNPIKDCDDVADLVETAYVAQGLLVVRQYFDGADPVEAEIRTRATRMWEAIEWDSFERQPGSGLLYWHDSPTAGCEQNLQLRGYHEAMITYLLAIASPTHPMPGSAFHDGWASTSHYVNGNTYYGIVQELGKPLGGPLFFAHYTYMSFDPRFKRDTYTNYFLNSRGVSLIHRAYAIDNPDGWSGYNRWGWGLTASSGPDGYAAHSPTNDSGTIAPTAALSSMPYTPTESIETLRYFFDTYGTNLVSSRGLFDAFNPSRDWFSSEYIPIDQGPIIVMIENYRSGLCWRLFMQNAEIDVMLDAIGFVYEPDLDNDGVIDGCDGARMLPLIGGPATASPGDPEAARACDRDQDMDVDLADMHAVQAMLN